MKRRTRRNFLIAGSAGTALALAGTAAVFSSPSLASGVFGHRGHFGRHGGGWGHGSELAAAHLRRGVEWTLSEVDGSDEQVERIVAIFEGALGELHGMRDAHRSQREAFAEALVAPEVDRAALETLRAEGVAMADNASSVFVTAFADAAEVLTAGQREELMQLHESHHGGFHP